MKKNKDDVVERRNTAFELTIEEENSRKVEGYALLFRVPSDGLDFEEVIEEGALEGVVERSNVFALLNHDETRGILARSKKGKGTLTLSVDNKGLKYRFEAPKTGLGDELLEHIRLGNISESSFAFTVKDEVWENKGKDRWKRTIKGIDRLYDVSPVYDGAYSTTTVSVRGREEAKAEMEKLIKEQEEKRKRELDAYFNNLNKNLN